MSDGIERVRDLITDILGEPKTAVYSNGWQSFNCPKCSEENGYPDNKYNLEVLLENESGGSFCHCWKCGYSSSIYSLIKRYGGKNKVDEFKEIISDIRSNQLYMLNTYVKSMVQEVFDISLPKGFQPFITNDGVVDNDGLVYLHSRKIDNNTIKKLNIGFVNNTGEYKYQNRIIIPSYDKFGELNYFIGRDWTNKNKVRYMNAKVEKTSIVFNEYNVQPYADIILCEGVFDSIALPNSIPLLGKTLTPEDAVFKFIVEKAKSNVIISLDNDAVSDAIKIYKLLNSTNLNGRVKFIEPKSKDASLVLQEDGKKGIAKLIQSARFLSEFELIEF